jgi:hypothetical protein
MAKPKRASFNALEYSPPAKFSNRKKTTLRGLIATCSFSILLIGYIYEGFKWREVDVDIANVMEAVARRSNPCYSYQRLEETAKFIIKKNLDTGNTSVIPDTPLYPSEGDNYNVDNWFNQINSSVSSYKGLCNQLIAIEPMIAEYEDNEKEGEKKYIKLLESNVKLYEKILTADFASAGNEIDRKLVTEKGKAVIPDGLHLMPYLRQFLLLRCISSGILFYCYCGPFLSFLSSKKTFKFGFNLLNFLAPWRL